MTVWSELSLARVPAGFPAAVGGELTATNVREAFGHGFFPLPSQDPAMIEINTEAYGDLVEAGLLTLLATPQGVSPYSVAWWHPAKRAVIPVGEVRLPSYLRQQLRNKFRWTTTVNRAFDKVVDECGRDRKRWLTEPLTKALSELHEQGWAHSVEVWSGNDLVGGVCGIGIGQVFSMDSTFHRLPGAGKVAFAELDRRLSTTAATLLDAQLPSTHMTALGAREISRADYLSHVLASADRLVPELGERDAVWQARQP